MSERGTGGGLIPLDLEIFSKKVVFLVLSEKKQISSLLAPWKIFGKSPSVPLPGKNPSDAHDETMIFFTLNLLIDFCNFFAKPLIFCETTAWCYVAFIIGGDCLWKTLSCQQFTMWQIAVELNTKHDSYLKLFGYTTLCGVRTKVVNWERS